MKDWGLHWFRRDLRTTGNPALDWNCKRHEGRVLGLFSFDQAFLDRPDFSVHRFGFFLEAMAELKRGLRALGGDLLVLDRAPDAAFRGLLENLRKQGALPAAVSWNRDYEPYARERDTRIQQLIEEGFGLPAHTERDHLLLEPAEIFKGDEKGTYYQIYTPFSKKWLGLLGEHETQERLGFQTKAFKKPLELKLTWNKLFEDKPGLAEKFQDSLESFREQVARRHSIPLPPAGEEAARARLLHFSKHAAQGYDKARDIPSVAGTSRLSIDLKNGSITTAQIIAKLDLKAPSKFLSELIWREFYYHILYHVPRVETGAFQAKYAGLAWENRTDHLEAWKQGLTGFPIVDAGMRQLRDTGWMHNRVRMIVASFLTKDLHCDWRLGEKHFMRLLLDGDLAPNNGGWQWAASTGCDAQPYFRIFNPTLQSKRFDPQGEYIRRWVPELASLPAPQIHEPWRKGDPGVRYPRPIVDHSVQARKAIALYKQLR